MISRKNILVFFLLGNISFGLSQSTKDSLVKLMSNAKDTTKAFYLNRLSRLVYSEGDLSDARAYATGALEQSKKLDYSNGICDACNTLGSLFEDEGEFEKALEMYTEALKTYEKSKDQLGIGGANNNIGNVYSDQGNYTKAMQYYIKALDIREKIGDKKGAAGTRNNIGIIFFNQGKVEQALEQYLLSLKIKVEIGDGSVDASYNNIGNTYATIGQYDEALSYYFKSLKLREQEGDKHGLSESYNNIGCVYSSQGDSFLILNKNVLAFQKFDAALESHSKSLIIKEEIGDKDGVTISLINMGEIYIAMENYPKAIDLLSKSLAVAKEISSLENVKYSTFWLSELYAKMGKHKEAYRYHLEFTSAKDSLLNYENQKQINEMQIKYESEKKDKELLKKDAELLKQNAESRQRATERNAFIGGFALMSVLAFFVFRSYRQKKKANIEINRQKELVQEKQKEILDSIHYARRIQQALLPTEKYISRTLKK